MTQTTRIKYMYICHSLLSIPYSFYLWNIFKIIFARWKYKAANINNNKLYSHWTKSKEEIVSSTNKNHKKNNKNIKSFNNKNRTTMTCGNI